MPVSRAGRVGHALARLDRRSQHPGIGTDGQSPFARVVIVRHAARQRDEGTRARLLGELARAPAGLAAAGIGDDPDLEQRGGLVLEVELRVRDTRPCAHHLHVARFGAAFVAHRIAVRDRAGADIGDDFHVGMRVGRKAGLGRDGVIVPDAQRAPVDAGRIMVAREGKMVVCIEPAVVGGAEGVEGPEFDHGVSPVWLRRR